VSKGLKVRLTEELKKILMTYEGEDFHSFKECIKLDCRNFLMKQGIQKVLMPDITVTIEKDNIVNVKVSGYGIPTKGN